MINGAELFSNGDTTPTLTTVAATTDINYSVVTPTNVNSQVNVKSQAESQSPGRNLALVASLSHELRTSVTGIDGNVPIMRSCNDDIKALMEQFKIGKISAVDLQTRMAKILAKSDRALNTVDICASHQKGLVNNVLDLSKFEAGKFELNTAEMDAREVVREALEIVSTTIAKKNLEVSFNCAKDVTLVEGDAGKLRQILVNLLSNAIKFTPSDKKISILLRKSSSDETHTTLELSVQDQGVGMTESEKADLFKAYSQPTQQSRQHVGTGLGLYLCAQLVKLMNGTMKVDSVKGEGSTFTFTIQCKKLAKIPRPSSPLVFSNLRVNTSNGERSIIEGETVNQQLLQIYFAEKGASSTSAGLGKKVVAELGVASPQAKKEGRKGECLIVDDNSINRQLLRGFLRSKGFNCTFATNGKEAVEACLIKKYDIILMDITMPIMDGLEATKLIRKNEKLGNVSPDSKPATIIAMPADTLDKDLLERVTACGMDDAITKPFNWPIVLAKIEKLIPPSPVNKQPSPKESNQPMSPMSPMSLESPACLDTAMRIIPSSPPVICSN